MTRLDGVLRSSRPALLALAGALVWAASALADDGAIQAKIERRLSKAGLAEAADIEVEVKSGAVTLRGVTMTLDEKRSAEKAARKESKAVTNLIRVFPDARPDADIVKDVRRAILRYPFYTVFDNVDLGVDSGVVLLRGSVRNEARRRDIEAAAAHVAGVREVKNEIGVQSASLFDEQLRRQLYVAIYGDRLLPFAGRPDGPVRIVVNDGRVTLAGWVNSEVDRQVFGHIARGTLAFQVENRIKVDGESPEVDQPKEKDRIVI